MAYYTVYTTSTGVIKKWVDTSATNIQANVRSGESYISGKYTHPEYKIIDGAAVKQTIAFDGPAYIRQARNDSLASSDWTQAADSPLSTSKKAEWATYRQTLRDYPASANCQNATSENDIIFPTPPE